MRRVWFVTAGLVLLGALAGCCHHRGACRGGCGGCDTCGDCCETSCDCGHSCGCAPGPGPGPAAPPGGVLVPTPSAVPPGLTDFGTSWAPPPAGAGAEGLRTMPRLVEPPMSQGAPGARR